MNIPTNPAGAPLLSCDLDGQCQELACQTCLDEIPSSALDTSEAPDYVVHYCGLECAAILKARHDLETESE